jgi:hypothetical protein
MRKSAAGAVRVVEAVSPEKDDTCPPRMLFEFMVLFIL